MTSGLRLSASTLALAYVVLSLAVLALFASPLGYEWRATIVEGRGELVQEDLRRLEEVQSRRGVEALAEAIGAQVGGKLTGKIILLTDPSHRKLAGNLDAWPGEMPRSAGTHLVDIDADGRTVHAALIGAQLPGGYELLVGRDIGRYMRLERFFWGSLAAAFGTILLLGVCVAVLIRRALLSEVQVLRQTTSAIVAGDLSRRLPTRGGADELDLLAQTVNRMLDQIEQLIHGVRNVSNAIAHDLRTPLAELRSRLEELAVAKPGPGETFAEIDAAVADVDRVIALFNALLRLAEIDTGARRSGFAVVDVARVAAEAVEFYMPLAEMKGVALVFEDTGEMKMSGDPLLLAQAIGNLVDNAIKYSSVPGMIRVQALRRADGAIDVVVSDEGPGIPDAEKPRVAERFYRGDASRCTPGVGLGLTLVAAVAKLHGGALDLADNRPGLKASLAGIRAAA